MDYNVKFFAIFREITGEREKTFHSDVPVNVKDALKQLVDRYGEKFSGELFKGDNIAEHYMVLVNGKNINFLNGLETKLENKDEIAILPPVGGGCTEQN
ncbi:MAG: ubiquitin-like small modifier protein 1 [Candidatus Bathyarchaeota archaeon]